MVREPPGAGVFWASIVTLLGSLARKSSVRTTRHSRAANATGPSPLARTAAASRAQHRQPPRGESARRWRRVRKAMQPARRAGHERRQKSAGPPGCDRGFERENGPGRQGPRPSDGETDMPHRGSRARWLPRWRATCCCNSYAHASRHTASARSSSRLTRLTALDDRRCIVSRPRHSHRGATMSAVKDEIARALDRAGDELEQLSRQIHHPPELGYQEVKASAWLAEFLGARVFKVERGIAGVDTAFRATLDTGDGPTVAIMCEYDALPGIGHACGHNVIAAAGAGAGVGLAAVREKLPKGRIH